MYIARRRLFQIAGLLAAWPFYARALPIDSAADPLGALPAFIDTLLPGDTHSPPASHLGLAARLQAGSEGRAAARELLYQGCLWLNREAREIGSGRFAALDATARIEVVRRAEAAPMGTLARRFFVSVLDASVRLYYTDPRTWSALGYEGPPQPHGFPDHAESP